jgi:hypothetical protein
MATEQTPPSGSAFEVLRQFARKRQAVERCELCSAKIASEHPHLLEPIARKLVCSCDACALLFSGRTDARFKRVPRRIRLLANFEMTDAQWDGLMIPINMAFFFYSSHGGRMVAMYPSPAGATESLLSLDAWTDITRGAPEIDQMEPDVEALLVNRIGHSRGFTSAEYYIVPIDHCYKLVGLIRSEWHGFWGGMEVWQRIGEFFTELRAKATVVGGERNA